MTKYDYQSPAHRKWARDLKKGVDACQVCRRPFFGPRGGRLRRAHAHHIFGAGVSTAGAVLCPSCHELITILSGSGGTVYADAGVRRRLWKLVKLRAAPHVSGTN